MFEQDEFRIFFYSNDHTPIHVHVRYAGGEAVFNIEAGVDLWESAGLKVRDLKRAQELAEQHRNLIVSKWHEFFDGQD